MSTVSTNVVPIKGSFENLICNLIKFLITVLLVYEEWYLQKYEAISNVLQVLAVAIIGLTILISLNVDLTKILNKVIVFWLLYGLFSLFVGAFNENSSHINNSLFTYFAFLSVIICAGLVSYITNDTKWFAKAIILVSLFCAFSVLLEPFKYKNGSYFVTTMSEYNNPNNLGLMMTLGIFYLLTYKGKGNFIGNAIRLVLSFYYVIIVLNTGSRSSLICAIAIIVLVLFFNIRYGGENSIISKGVYRLGILALGIVVFFVIINYAFNNNLQGSAISRLFEKFNKESFEGRTELYVLAIDYFKENMLFGIGYNCFAKVASQGYFTHSTYMELLSCSGIIGTFLFGYPVVNRYFAAIKNMKRDEGRSFTIITLFLVSSFFGIVHYNMVFLMVMYFGLSLLEMENINDKVLYN